METSENPPPIKQLLWVGPSLNDLRAFPTAVRQEVGFALYLAQQGHKAPKAKPLRGFGGTGVLEVVSNHEGDTYRAVYTVKLANAVYVLHAFQKKSHKGSATPKADRDLIQQRLKLAIEADRELAKRDTP